MQQGVELIPGNTEVQLRIISSKTFLFLWMYVCMYVLQSSVCGAFYSSFVHCLTHTLISLCRCFLLCICARPLAISSSSLALAGGPHST